LPDLLYLYFQEAFSEVEPFIFLPQYSLPLSVRTFSTAMPFPLFCDLSGECDHTTVNRLSNDLSTDNNPSFSHDGIEIAYKSNRDGNYEVYYMNAEGSGQIKCHC